MYKKYFGLKNKAWSAKAGYYKPLPPEPKIDISKNIEEFLAAGGTITKLPPHEEKAKPYATKKEMRRRTEMGWDGKGVSGGAGRSAPKNEKVFICGGKEIMTNLEEELKELQEELDDALGTLASWRARANELERARANELDRLNYKLALENKALREKIEQLERRNKNAEV